MKERARGARGTAVAAFAGLVLVLPLATMEWATQSELPRSRFHFIWFVYLWFLVVLFILTSRGAFRTALAMRSGHLAISRTVGLSEGCSSRLARVDVAIDGDRPMAVLPRSHRLLARPKEFS
jgi:hypothetical protein